MLKKILEIIHNEGMYSKSYIANKLHISESIAEDGLFRLINLGYIDEEKSAQDCGANCKTCPLANCSKEIFKTYKITEKGLDLLE